MKAKLVVVGGDAKAAEITLKLPTVVGRGRGATLVLPHPLVSRRHCEIVESDGQLLVRDLGSLNGTFVGNERVEERGEAVLPPGELLTIGAVTFRAIYGVEANNEAVGHDDGNKTVSNKPSAKTVRAGRPGTVRVRPAENQTEAAAADETEDLPGDDPFEFVELDDDDDSIEDDRIDPHAVPPLAAPPAAMSAPPQVEPPVAEDQDPDEGDDALKSFLDGMK